MLLHHKREGAYDVHPVDHPDIHVEPNSNFEVGDPTLARSLLEQDDNYGPADDESRAVWGDIVAERTPPAAPEPEAEPTAAKRAKPKKDDPSTGDLADKQEA